MTKKIIYSTAVIITILIAVWLIILIGDIKILISETKTDIPYSYEIGQGDIGETTRAMLLCKYFNGRRILYRTNWIEYGKEYCPFIDKE